MLKGYIGVGSCHLTLINFSYIKSGIRVFSKGGEPQLIEGDIFKIIIPLTPNVKRVDSEKTVEKIIRLIKENPKITIKEMEKATGLTYL